MSKYKKTTKFSLDEKITNSKFNFCKNLKWFLIAPIVIIVVGIVLFCTLGFNLGIDFTGGSNMTVFTNSKGTFSDLASYDLERDMDEVEKKISDVLAQHGLKISTLQQTTMDNRDLGISQEDAVIVKYQNDNSLSTEEIESINEEIRLELLKSFGYVDEDVQNSDLASEHYAGLVTNGGITTASAGAELMMRSFLALLVALLLILIYVAFRFDLSSGLAAILALFHDALVTTAVMLIFRIQINAAFIAALITILGYSVNNTIIIFDRIRDRLKIARQNNEKISNAEIANSSVKETMMRSILTTLTTFIMIFMITVIGVSAIQEFAFPIMVGIVAGFYSSVFLTPGLWAIGYHGKKKKKVKKETPETVEVSNP